MAWFGGKVSLADLDFARAVNKLSESVKNIEKNFDTALGLEENADAAGSGSEAALHGAARQAQAKADEIAKFMNENEQLKAVIDDLRGKTNEAEIESLREEYHQRVATLERKLLLLFRFE